MTTLPAEPGPLFDLALESLSVESFGTSHQIRLLSALQCRETTRSDKTLSNRGLL